MISCSFISLLCHFAGTETLTPCRLRTVSRLRLQMHAIADFRADGCGQDPRAVHDRRLPRPRYFAGDDDISWDVPRPGAARGDHGWGCGFVTNMNKMTVTQVSLMTQTHRASALAPENSKTTGPDDVSHGVAE